jgi:dienelactone hydrolase
MSNHGSVSGRKFINGRRIPITAAVSHDTSTNFSVSREINPHMKLPHLINRLIKGLLLLAVACAVGSAEDAVPIAAKFPIGQVFKAADTLAAPVDESVNAMECLSGLCWTGAAFSVRCESTTQIGANAVFRFPSAKPVGDAINDLVAMEWYAVLDDAGRPVKAPAMVVVHESGSGMTVGRMVARGLRDRGLHAFMMQLPFYGLRRSPEKNRDEQEFAALMSQGIADTRRSLDAVAALPWIDPENVSLQGTSLGGFVAATSSGLDAAYRNVFVLLAGGDLPKLVMTGERETASLRRQLEAKGFIGPTLYELLNRFEPNRLAHRIPANRLWVYSANFDTTVPPTHAESFAKAAGISDDHHIRMPASHYSGVLFLPVVLDQIATQCGGRAILATALKQP